MEAVWRERAHRLSQRPESGGAARDAVPVIILGIGKERYGVDLQDVAEVLPPVCVTPVPGAAAVFAGVVNVHGEIRPVIDLRRFLGIQTGIEASIETGIETPQDGGLARVIVLRKDGRETGLRIDSVEQIRWIAAEDLHAAGSPHLPSPRIKGSTKDMLTLLSTEALFAELQTGVAT